MHHNLKEQVTTILNLAGFSEPSVTVASEEKRIEVFLNEGDWLKKFLPSLVGDLDYVVKLMARRSGADDISVDVNSYRRERERLIVELAKAAAKKATVVKQVVRLPAMNSYERRLVHVELAIHPDVRTESEGEGKERCVVIKPI